MSILIVVVLLVAGLVVFIATRPAQFRVERSALIQAPPAALQAQIEDFHQWPHWSPWARRDPAMKVDYEGPERGVGAIQRWMGNKDVGVGSATIVDSVPGERVQVLLEFIEPFRATSLAEFRFTPEGAGTRVSWSMTGNNGFIGKAISLVCDVDGRVGGDFEQGLQQLRMRVEES
ncbi:MULTISPECIES: SRPBCC family protein [unclassified Pseudomonas]|uniref:SRPBCC family protein n=1 Tax=unclassified Pseudomonas TaxID=196821 RepID=UPI00244C8446|nr:MULTISPECIES: SRPBCC family protein [unclassified Pseudomonas]MDG9930550.1 SRPBCC family protein [Pseudomonas sp. GD04042]MDH0484837.1 SRPBCC family protein [Pseudomonas sp. GD04015]MDH0607219.1 SRPBCC family protein [Pseudomonas sp. GD03869]